MSRKWRKISEVSPPEDGTLFLAYDPKEKLGSQVVILYFCSSRMRRLGNGYEELHSYRHYTWRPTHWMKLPLRPKE